MSCGDPHQTDCTEVLDRVYDYLDGEIDEEWRARIREHLQECGPCLRQYGLEQLVKTLVVRSCTCHVAPEQLRLQVVARLHEIRISHERREYRPH